MDFITLLKSVAVLIIFFISYELLLKKENFFKLNRAYLVSGLLLAIIIPFITITKIVWIEASKVLPIISFPSSETVLVPTTISATEDTFHINWLLIASIIYAIGILFFFIRFIIQLYSIKAQTSNGEKEFSNRIKYVNSPKNNSPFSFFNTIVYNKNQFSHQELETILNHEKAHCQQWHSIDVILSQLICILQWFNPLAWKYQKAIQNNLEFLADQSTINQNISTKDYQYLLVKTSVSSEQYCSITHHFNHLLIKKRIKMLNKKTTSKSYWKTLFILPILIGFVYSCNQKTETKIKDVASNEYKEKQQAQLYDIKDSTSFRTVLDYMAKPHQPKIITQENLTDWLDNKKYGLWIDGNKQNNSVLENYSPKDFSNFHISTLQKNAKDYGKYTYHLNLETNAYFKQRVKNWIPIPSDKIKINQPLHKDSIIAFIQPIHSNDLKKITSGYGMRKNPITSERKKHLGIDYTAPRGTPVYASSTGIVSFSASNGNYGKTIKIKHINGYETRYCHLNSLLVNKGDKVTMGQEIAAVGVTGLTTGPHLHFEALKDGKHLNPKTLLTSNENKSNTSKIKTKYTLFHIDKHSSDNTLKEVERYFEKHFKTTKIQFSEISRNANEEIITLSFKTKLNNQKDFSLRFNASKIEKPIDSYTIIPKSENLFYILNGNETLLKFTENDMQMELFN